MAENINNPVANNERGESREIPQMPCPLVHPEPNVVPMPTSKPAMIKPVFSETGLNAATLPPNS